jgi:hypothetical protein
MDRFDVDWFATAGATAERQMTVKIANASPTLHPNLVVYDAGKTQIGAASNTTAGGDLTYSFKAPKGRIYLRVADHYTGDKGDYVLTIAPQ